MSITVVLNELAKEALVESSYPFKWLTQSPREISAGSFYALVWQLFTAEKSQPPIAALMALADDLPAYKDYWFCAEPVKFQVDYDQVYLLPKESVSITRHFAHEFAANLNLLLIPDHLKLLIGAENRWYIHAMKDPGVHTFPYSEVSGKPITHYLPQGLRADYWKKLLTEIQMLSNQISQKLKDKENTGIDGIWIWGEGGLQRKYKAPYHQVIAESAFVRGLADWCGIKSQDFSVLPAALKNDYAHLFIEINNSLQLSILLQQDISVIERMDFYTSTGEKLHIKPAPFYKQWIKRIFHREKTNPTA